MTTPSRSVEGAVAAGTDDRVELTEGATAAVGQFGGQRGVPAEQAAFAQDRRQRQVGVGAAGADGGEQIEGGLPGRVDDWAAGGSVAGGGGRPLPVPLPGLCGRPRSGFVIRHRFGLGGGSLGRVVMSSTRRSARSVPTAPVGRSACRSVSTVPGSGRAPRAQSAAASGLAAGRGDRPSRTAVVAVPTSTSRLPAAQLARGADPPCPSAATGPRTSRPHGESVHAPGSGVSERISRSQHRGRLGPVDPGVVDGDLARVGDAVGRLRTSLRRCRRPARRGWPPAAGHPRSASRVQQVAGGVVGPDRLGDQTVDRAGVHAGLEPEGGGAGDVVPGPDRRLHRRRPRARPAAG